MYLKQECLMKKIFLVPLLTMLMALSQLAIAQNIGVVDTSTPDSLIKTATTDVLRSIKAEPALQRGDIATIVKFVNEKILPYSDFRYTTSLVMGRAWRQATPQQKNQIVEQFKMLLIRTYAGALSQVGNQQITYEPLRMAQGATDAVVRSQVLNQGQVVQLDYRLRKTANGWRVYDVGIMNVWMIPTYQQQFAEQIPQRGIDGLIQFLTQRNQALAHGNTA
jgi:phospholipid transport system substrate-binding protein